MIFTVALLIFYFVKLTDGQSCPEEYQRFSKQHTYCMAPNPQCKIMVRGFDQEKYIQQILHLHNNYRNKVSMGQETQAGHLPTASNMMQMVWDEELAAVAQKWAENCVFAHDCNDCRTVESFSVGQNIAYIPMYCKEGKCGDEQNGKQPSWKRIIDMFYNEVKDYNKDDLLKSGPSRNGMAIGHFTQLVWAKTWRVGCGFVAHQNGDWTTHFFVCNYGPGGNIMDTPVYIPGNICSKCPLNSCCGSECPQADEFLGLCKMNNVNETPQFPISKEGLIFHCDFSKESKDCSYKIEGQTGNMKHTLQGTVYSVWLKSGQHSEIFFDTPIIADNSNFCLRIEFRKMPSRAGAYDHSQMEVNMVPKGAYRMSSNLFVYGIQYVKYGIIMSGVQEMTFSVKFSLPADVPNHLMQMKEIMAFKGECNSRKD